jgi:hypothetical protein
MAKKNWVYIYDVILFLAIKIEWSLVIVDNMDGARVHYVYWHKPGTQI